MAQHKVPYTDIFSAETVRFLNDTSIILAKYGNKFGLPLNKTGGIIVQSTEIKI